MHQFHFGGPDALAVDWTEIAATLDSWIRARVFPPFQLPCATLRGVRVQIVRSRLLPGSSNKPGIVTAVGGEHRGLAVGAKWGGILLQVRGGGGRGRGLICFLFGLARAHAPPCLRGNARWARAHPRGRAGPHTAGAARGRCGGLGRRVRGSTRDRRRYGCSHGVSHLVAIAAATAATAGDRTQCVRGSGRRRPVRPPAERWTASNVRSRC